MVAMAFTQRRVFWCGSRQNYDISRLRSELRAICVDSSWNSVLFNFILPLHIFDFRKQLLKNGKISAICLTRNAIIPR